MMLLTKADMKKLLDNGARQKKTGACDASPVVKFFNPVGAATWLISEIDPEDHDRAFGLCDLGSGTPELGYVSIKELSSVRLRFGMKIERDRHFSPTMTLVEYAAKARRDRSIQA
jgi:hypothetical protein